MTTNKYYRNLRKLCPEFYEYCSSDELPTFVDRRNETLGKAGYNFFFFENDHGIHYTKFPIGVAGNYRRMKMLEFIRYNQERILFILL